MMDEAEAKARVDAALERASDELGLASYYRDCVRPLLRQPREQWPICCGGGCEPCSQILVLVADRVQEFLEEPVRPSSPRQ